MTKLCKAFRNFINPFDIECRDALYCLSSGAEAPPVIENELLKVGEFRKEAFKDFVQTRLVEKTVPFHSPMHKQKLKTLAKIFIHKKVTSTQNKVEQIAAQRNVFEQMLVATRDGFSAKTDNAKLLHKLEDDTGYEDIIQLDDKVYKKHLLDYIKPLVSLQNYNNNLFIKLIFHTICSKAHKIR